MIKRPVGGTKFSATIFQVYPLGFLFASNNFPLADAPSVTVFLGFMQGFPEDGQPGVRDRKDAVVLDQPV